MGISSFGTGHSSHSSITKTGIQYTEVDSCLLFPELSGGSTYDNVFSVARLEDTAALNAGLRPRQARCADVESDPGGAARPEDDDQSDGFTKNLLLVDFFAYSLTNSGLTASLSESVPL